jgi:transposase
MAKSSRVRCTLEYKLEAVRMAKGGQSLAAVSRILGIADQTLHNWVKAEREGRLSGAIGVENAFERSPVGGGFYAPTDDPVNDQCGRCSWCQLSSNNPQSGMRQETWTG